MPFNKLKCVCCGHNKFKGQTRKISGKHIEWLRCNDIQVVDRDGILCSKCITFYYRKSSAVNQSNDQNTDESNVIILPFPSIVKRKNTCFICYKKGPGKVFSPAESRAELFLKQGVLVPSGVYCCKKHLENGHLKSDVSIDLRAVNKSSSSISSVELTEILNNIRKVHDLKAKSRINFDSATLSDQDYFNLTGISKQQFDDLTQHLISIRPTKLRSVRQAVGMLLLKLRTGLSLRMLGTHCGFERKTQVSRIVQSAKTALISDFVPLYLGFDAISREEVLDQHTSDFAIQLFSNFISNSVILILDGTYIYIQKSTKHTFQRRCFSMHKHRPLIKPMMVVSTTGYIVSVIGPFFADGKNNDAAIAKKMISSNLDNINQWLQKGDIFILDRGFRDALPFLKRCGYQTESPSFLPKSTKQMPTADANSSRLVTKIRWAVESVNGRVKSWKYFDQVVPNSDLANVKHYLFIVCAISNKYWPPLVKNTEEDCDIARKMVELAQKENHVQERIANVKNLSHRSSTWCLVKNGDSAVPDFPKLSEDGIRSMTFGIYQVGQASKYVDENMIGRKSDVYFSNVTKDLVHARIQSRHTSSKQHNLWVEYSQSEITGWFCQCPSGARTVGCCSHVASIVWYLAFARHNGYQPKTDRLTPLIQDAAAVSSSDSDDDDDDGDHVDD